MMYAQYCRIESWAGGYACSDRQFIRKARSICTKKGLSRASRAGRQRWLRDGLDHLSRARQLHFA